MALSSQDYFYLAPEFGPTARRVGIDVRSIFELPGIVVWRRLPDRENAYIDLEDDSNRPTRWHIKRFIAQKSTPLPAQIEAQAHQLIQAEKIPTAKLVGWGWLGDRRSFIIFEDLAGYIPADKLIGSGFPFDRLLVPTAKLAAGLHTRGLHHRDLYLCHFMVKLPGDLADNTGENSEIDICLIDTARVRKLPTIFRRARWVVKDLAQFLYSSTKLPVTESQRDAWLEQYSRERGFPSSNTLRGPIQRKIRYIAKHDARLMKLHPYRDVSIG